MLNYRFTLNDKDITDKLLSVNYSENLEDVASSFSFTSLEDFDITKTLRYLQNQRIDF